jgi:hypothetical protein
MSAEADHRAEGCGPLRFLLEFIEYEAGWLMLFVYAIIAALYNLLFKSVTSLEVYNQAASVRQWRIGFVN